MESYSLWPFGTGFLSLSVQGQSLLVCVLVLHSFSWQSNIPPRGETTFYQSVHLLVDIWVVSIWWLL